MTASPRIDDGVRLRALVEGSAAAMPASPLAPSAFSERAEEATLAWAARTGIARDAVGQRLARIGVGAFAAYTYPRAPSELVELGANLIAWLYLFDDRYGEPCDDAMFAAVVALVAEDQRPVPSNPFFDAMRDVVERAGRLRSGAWRRRFACSLGAYFEGCRLELPYRRSRSCPSFERYREIRRFSIGAFPVFDLVELGLDGELDDEVLEGAPMREIRSLAACLTAWVNDAYSFAKERAEGDPLNLVSVLCAERGLTVERAFEDTASLYESDLRRLLELVDAFPHSRENEGLERAYLRGLLEWVHGNHAWTKTCGRYLTVT